MRLIDSFLDSWPGFRRISQSRFFHSSGWGIVLAIIGIALFSTKGIAAKLIYQADIDPITLMSWRMGLALPFFLGIGYWTYRSQQKTSAKAESTPQAPLSLKDWSAMLMVGMLGYYLSTFLDFWGLTLVSAQYERLVLMMYPFFVVLISAIFLKTPVNAGMIIGLVGGYLGIVVIFIRDLQIVGDGLILGTVLILGAGLCFACYQLFAKKFIDHVGARLFISVAMTGATLATWVHFLIAHPLADLAVDSRTLGLLVYVALFATVLPSYMIGYALGLIGPQRTAIVSNVGPITTIIFSIWILNEDFLAHHAFGALLVMVGMYVFNRAEQRVSNKAS